jgi:hypothetical protein
VFHADIGRLEYLRLMWEDCRFNLGKDHTMDKWPIHMFLHCDTMREKKCLVAVQTLSAMMGVLLCHNLLVSFAEIGFVRGLG